MGCRKCAQSPSLSSHSCGEGRLQSCIIHRTSGRRRPQREDEHPRGGAVPCCYGITRLAGLTPRGRMWCREGVGRTWNHKALLVGPRRRRSLQTFPVSRLLRLRSAWPACWLRGGTRRDPWRLGISLMDSSTWGEGQPPGPKGKGQILRWSAPPVPQLPRKQGLSVDPLLTPGSRLCPPFCYRPPQEKWIASLEIPGRPPAWQLLPEQSVEYRLLPVSFQSSPWRDSNLLL